MVSGDHNANFKLSTHKQALLATCTLCSIKNRYFLFSSVSPKKMTTLAQKMSMNIAEYIKILAMQNLLNW